MMSLVHFVVYLFLGLFATSVQAYWRMTCGVIQTGRVDPVISYGSLSGHVHKISGANTIDLSSTFDSLQESRCTSCEIQKDLSAYWTPQLYYEHANGSFEEVPNGGTVVYYLGRGDNRDQIQPFPPGFKMYSGDTFARSYKDDILTWDGGRPISDRVTFVCITPSETRPQTGNLTYLDCADGMRAQIQFQSCWDGVNLYREDQSHVAYLSQIDNGVCPDTHPVLLPHLFFEVYYSVNSIDKSDGGRFVFANGDTTGYGFHGDFINGWDNQTLANGIHQCINNDSVTYPAACPAFVVDPYATDNCPEQRPVVNEKVHGWLDKLPGCNPITSGPEDATAVANCNETASLTNYTQATNTSMLNPEPGYVLGNWTYLGCADEPTNGRALNSADYSNSTGMSIDQCTTYCASKNLPYAGLEYGDECWCGSTLGATLLSASVCDTTHKMLCSGNYSEWCGGPSLLQVWNNTAWVNPVPTVGESTILDGKAVYAGCYSEATGIRTLSKASTSGTNNTVQTNERCGTFCLALGYSFFGTEYSAECYCGNVIEAGSVLESPSDCGMTCNGNVQELCGGSNRLSVWHATELAASNASTSISTSSSTSMSSSAFSSSAIPTSNSSSTSPTSSASVRIDGALTTVTGISSSSSSSLSSFLTTSPSSSSVSTTASRSTSPSSSTASTTVSISTTSASPTPTLGYYSLGCYYDGARTRELRYEILANDTMSVEHCLSYAQQFLTRQPARTYAYVGLEYGRECWAATSAPASPLTSLVGNRACTMACRGNPTESCGGPTQFNYYVTSSLATASMSVVTSTTGTVSTRTTQVA